MDVIIFGGQSNMQGQSEALTGTEPIEGAYEYRYFGDCAVPLKNPVGEDITYGKEWHEPLSEDSDFSEWVNSTALGSACYGNTNMVPEFCRKYIEDTGRKVIAVHCAKGSTQAFQWLPDTERFEVLEEKVLRAVKKAKETDSVEHIYFVWLQGESDAIFKTSKETYKEQLTVINEALKERLGVEKFGIIRVGRFTNDERDLVIIEAQDEICRENSDFLMLTDIATELNKIPEYMNPYVGGHFGVKGLEKLGYEGGKALAKFTLGK